MRYDLLIEACRRKQPKAILEIGTWNGGRAKQLLGASPQAVYYGFDLFELATAQTDKHEMNVKAHNVCRDVQKMLGPRATLFRGNTNDTLPLFNEKIDFAWIDGGHSIATIASDWANVQRLLLPDAEVYFDDYFTGPIDTKKWGCNQCVEQLKYELLPTKDPVKGGGWTQIARVYP